MSRWLIIVGIFLVILGLVMHYAPWLVSWFGKLPGDIRLSSERNHLFIPITSMIVISLVLTLIVNIFGRH